jgi:hypothetical protein
VFISLKMASQSLIFGGNDDRVALLRSAALLGRHDEGFILGVGESSFLHDSIELGDHVLIVSIQCVYVDSLCSSSTRKVILCCHLLGFTIVLLPPLACPCRCSARASFRFAVTRGFQCLRTVWVYRSSSFALLFALFLLLASPNGRWQRSDLQAVADLSKLIDGQDGAWCLLVLVQTGVDGGVGNLDHVDDFSNGSAEVVHSRSEDDARSAQSGGLATLYHPIAVHTLQYLAGIVGNLVRRLGEFEFATVLQHQRLDLLDGLVSYELGRIPFAQQTKEGLVSISQSPDVDLDFLGQVHQHQGVVCVPPGSHVQGHSSNVPYAAALDEMVVYGEFVPAEGLVFHDLSYVEGSAELLDLASSYHLRLLPAAHTPKTPHGATH